MLHGQTVFALIPARAGSKGLPGKNLRDLGGRPLLAWSVAAARESGVVDRIVVSTDGGDIARAALEAGAEVEMRPEALATDEATAADVVRHHLSVWRQRGGPPDVVVYLQPTSPLRTGEDVAEAAIRLVEGELDSLTSFCEAAAHPESAWRMNSDGPAPWNPDVTPWRRRQELEPAFTLNGAVYAFRAERFPDSGDRFLFGRVGSIVMPAERSVDIDDAVDFALAEVLIRDRV